ncbi:YlmH family RNA-binding protein [Clostridium tepidum]
MNKETFLNRANIEDKSLLLDIYNKAILAEKTGKQLFSSYFCTNNICRVSRELANSLNLKINMFGVFKDSERRIIGFNVYDTADFPLVLAKISYNSKFVNLKHKDFLGALTSLGIRREKMGDLVLKENNCYVPIYEDLYEYIAINLNHIAKSPCRIEKMDLKTQVIPEFNFQEKSIIVSSNRADSIVASLCNISRSKALDLIKSSKVFIDYEEVKSKNREIDIESIVTIRGYGKFKMDSFLGKTAKGRIKILFKKFI